MQTSCCYCHRPFNVKPEQAGTVVSCPHCFGQLQLPPPVSRRSPDSPVNPIFIPPVEERQYGKKADEVDELTWVRVLRVIGVLNAALSLLGVIFGIFYEDADVRRSSWILFGVGLIGAFQSFFMAFLVEVFLDIRSLLRTLVERKD